jgi:hypothetical protein
LLLHCGPVLYKSERAIGEITDIEEEDGKYLQYVVVKAVRKEDTK